MDNTEKFNETVGILVKAYLNDTLEHGNCHACAVGNIIAAHCGYKYVKIKNRFCSVRWKDNPKQRWYHEDIGVYESDQTTATGYSKKDIFNIEAAFECTRFNRNSMFTGLMAVVDVLAEIHGIDLTQKQSAKELFIK